MDILISTPSIILDIKKSIINEFSTNQISKNETVICTNNITNNFLFFHIDIINRNLLIL